MTRFIRAGGARWRAMTLVEISVVVGIVAVVLGLILQAMTDTEGAVNDLERSQLLRQEAILIAQAVDKELRARVAPGDADAVTTAAADGEKFASDHLRVCTLAGGGTPDTLSATVRTVTGQDGARRVVIQRTAAGSAATDDAPVKMLGQNADKIQSEISFRYLTAASETETQWVSESAEAPVVVEYSIRLWPMDKRFADFESARKTLGSAGAFEYVSGVALP